MNGRNYTRLTVGAVAVWFAFSLIASAYNVFKAPAGQPPIPTALAASIPLALFLICFAVFRGYRDFLLGLNPQILTMLHSWRLIGFTLLALYSYGILPGMFALPAAWGDIFMAMTAPFVAMQLANRKHLKSFVLWQILGIADLVTAIATATVAAIIRPHGIGPDAMASLPLSVIPTFGVPLLLILHVISLAQAWRWKELPSTQSGRSLLAPAA
jgi:hypothetical protein